MRRHGTARAGAVGASLVVLLFACDREPAEKTAPAGEVRSASRKDILSTEKKLYSQNDEELIIRDFFQDRENGFFVDIGCAWPVNNSNTYYLESRLGWSGIGVDALPEYARRWRNRRLRSKFFNYIVTDHSGTVESFYRTARPDLRGISTITPGTGLGANQEYEEIRVPTITLTELLEQNDASRIDLLSMDIESAEPLALAGFDIDRFKPELVCIEAHPPVREQILEYFSSHRYQRIERYAKRDFMNYYFTPEPESR